MSASEHGHATALTGGPRDYPSDRAMMRAIQEGHLDLLGVLYERHSSRVSAQCSGMVDDVEAVDDLVQEVFLRVLRYRQSYRGEAQFTTWLHRITRNVCLDHISARKKDKAVDGHLASRPEAEPAQRPGAERLAVLRRALDSLDTEKRDLLVWRRLEGLSYAELAERFGVTEGALRVRVHRATIELKAAFDALWDGPS